ncbi:hypothetical protein ACFO0N_15125 [Halobium salinum]|uniref:Uncharacterized protein n=1 Tax=Halobium salinum TaxID=1364940 RepID=A0ABD5PF34_9EURY|nr:hypothetical protein [Halobium salinum]
MTDIFDQIREKDRTVLQYISDGDDDIQLITDATTLSNAEVNYCFQKLQDLSLITVEKPDGMVERVINGTLQKFEAPKQAELTDAGKKYLERNSGEELTRYKDLNAQELGCTIRELEKRVDSLENELTGFKKFVRRKLDQPDN